MDFFVIETERLGLRPHRLEDIPFMVEFSSDPEVTRFTGDSALDEAEALAIVSRLTVQFETAKMGRFIAIEKSSGERIGWAGLAILKDRNVVDLGYRFLRKKWGLGYGTESARACLRYGFVNLKLPEITARVDARNLASMHVLKKLRRQQSEIFRDEEGEFFDFKMLKEEHNEF
jgi:ribosomal-protein-alanine N-acetyltransferase